MISVYPNLVDVMKKRGIGCKELADILGISYYAAYRRLRGFAEWKFCETICLCEMFEISDVAWLFTRGDTISQKS